MNFYLPIYYVSSAIAISFITTCACCVGALNQKDMSKAAPIYHGIGRYCLVLTTFTGLLSYLSYLIWGFLNIGWTSILWMVLAFVIRVTVYGIYDRMQYADNPSAIIFHQVVAASLSICGFLAVITFNLVLWFGR